MTGRQKKSRIIFFSQCCRYLQSDQVTRQAGMRSHSGRTLEVMRGGWAPTKSLMNKLKARLWSHLGEIDRAQPHRSARHDEFDLHHPRWILQRRLREGAPSIFQNFQTFIGRLLGQLQRDDTFGLRLHALPPELEFGVDGSVEDKFLFEALGVKGADRRVVAHLLRYEPEAQVLSGTHGDDAQWLIMIWCIRVTASCCAVPAYLTSS